MKNTRSLSDNAITAKEAFNLSAVDDIEYVYEKIRKSADSGKMRIQLFSFISDAIAIELANQGFSISFGTEYNNWGTHISWFDNFCTPKQLKKILP